MRAARGWTVPLALVALLAVAWVTLGRSFVARDSCLDRGGMWLDDACLGQRPRD